MSENKSGVIELSNSEILDYYEEEKAVDHQPPV